MVLSRHFSAGITKKLSAKISKHDTTIALSRAKVNTITDLVLQGFCVTEKIDDVEFSLILAEEKKYENLKSEIRNKKTIVKDLSEETRKKIYLEAKEELQRKTRSVNIYFEKSETGFHLHIERRSGSYAN